VFDPLPFPFVPFEPFPFELPFPGELGGRDNATANTPPVTANTMRTTATSTTLLSSPLLPRGTSCTILAPEPTYGEDDGTDSVPPQKAQYRSPALVSLPQLGQCNPILLLQSFRTYAREQNLSGTRLSLCIRLCFKVYWGKHPMVSRSILSVSSASLCIPLTLELRRLVRCCARVLSHYYS
jgi:hypothetical protein